MISTDERVALNKRFNASLSKVAPVAAAGAAILTVAASPAHAQTAGGDLSGTVSQLQGIATAVVGVGLGVLAWRVGVKLVNRAMTKG